MPAQELVHPPSAPPLGSPHRLDVLTGALLFLACMALYFQIGIRLASSPAHPFAYPNLFFGIDTPRVIGDMTRLDANHYRTNVHPLYVLLVNPVGLGLARIVFRDAVTAAVALTALLGALNAIGAFVLFRRMDLSTSRAALLASGFALSTSQLVLSSVPDTSSLATISLVTTYLVFHRALETRSVRTKSWLLAGLFSLGVTTTNFAQTLVCHVVARMNATKASVPAVVRPVVRYTLTVLAVAAALALLQKVLFPSSSLFFLPSAYREEGGYSSLSVLSDPRPVLSELAKQFFVDGIAGPLPRTIDVGQRWPGVTFSQAWDFSIVGAFAIVLWLAGGLAAAVVALRRGGAFTVGIALCLAFNLALHSVYGAERGQAINYFQYSGNCTLAMFALVAQPIARAPRWVILPLVALVLALGFNNLSVMARLIALYQGS